MTNVITAADAATVLAMQPKEDKEWEGLFGTKLFGKGEEGEDAYEVSCHTSRRGMKELDKDKRPVATILAAIHTVLVMHGLVNDNHFVDATSLLLSLPGAPKQSYHHDFKDWTGTPGGKLFKRRALNADGTLPHALSVLIALEDGASWMVRRTGEKEKQIFIPRLGAVVFRGDLTHAGSAYKKRNVRLHIYYGVTDPVDGVISAPRDEKGVISVVRGGGG